MWEAKLLTGNTYTEICSQLGLLVLLLLLLMKLDAHTGSSELWCRCILNESWSLMTEDSAFVSMRTCNRRQHTTSIALRRTTNIPTEGASIGSGWISDEEPATRRRTVPSDAPVAKVWIKLHATDELLLLLLSLLLLLLLLSLLLLLCHRCPNPPNSTHSDTSTTGMPRLVVSRPVIRVDGRHCQ